MKTNKLLTCSIAAGILVAGVLPLVLYRLFFVGVPGFLVDSLHPTLPFRATSLFEQWLVVITAFGVKPAYMVLSLLWIIWLRRQTSPDLAALRWGLISFLAGESACAVNYLFFGGLCDLADYLHSYGMAVSFSFVTYAALEGLDLRVVKYSAATDRCAALSLCRACIKHAEVPCGLRRVFTMLIPASIAVAFMPLCADLRAVSYDTTILNSLQHYSSPLSCQWFESRYCVWLAALLLSASWLVLVLKREDPVGPAKVLFAAAMGPLSFSLMRLFLRAAYSDDLVWSNVWEELTELVFVTATGFVLWVFRRGLFREASAPTGGPDAQPAPA